MEQLIRETVRDEIKKMFFDQANLVPKPEIREFCCEAAIVMPEDDDKDMGSQPLDLSIRTTRGADVRCAPKVEVITLDSEEESNDDEQETPGSARTTGFSLPASRLMQSKQTAEFLTNFIKKEFVGIMGVDSNPFKAHDDRVSQHFGSGPSVKSNPHRREDSESTTRRLVTRETQFNTPLLIRSDLHNGESDMHASQMIHSCEICDRAFKSARGRKIHQATHSRPGR